MKHLYVFAALLFAGSVVYAQDCSDNRYKTQKFSTINVEKDIKYGQNLKQDESTMEELFMDIYMPDGDTDTERPVILLAHGGSYIGGNRGDIKELCENYAKLGYVTASMSYRLLDVTDPSIIFGGDLGLEFKKEVVRSVHDMKAAVRFLRQSVEEGNPYGIDPDQVIVGGWSAGAITANHLAYLNTEEKIPSELVDYFAAQGGLEGESGNEGYASDAKMVISYCGGINDTTWIDAGSVPFVGIHTDGDQTVPNLVGEPNIGLPVPVTLFGDSLMYKRALNQNVEAKYKMYISDAHCDFEEPDAFIFASSFVYEQVCGEPGDVTVGVEENEVFFFNMYPNPATDQLTISFKDKQEASAIQIFDNTGKVVSTSMLNKNQNKAILNVSSLRTGNYHIRVTHSNGETSSQQFIKQ